MKYIENEKLISTTEIAKQLHTSNNVITEATKKCLPNKVIKNGVATKYTKEEVTIVLDYIKNSSNRNDLDTYKTSLIATSTGKEKELKLYKLHQETQQLDLKEQIQLSLQLQANIIQRLNDENILLKDENQELKDKVISREESLSSFINLSSPEYEREHDGRSKKSKKLNYYID